MGTAAQLLGTFAADLRYEDIPAAAVARAKRLILDTLGCALGAYHATPCTLISQMVLEWGGAPESTLVGDGRKVPAPSAALVNGAMIRYLDFNDTLWLPPSTGGLHPSDSIAEVLAVAEQVHADGKAILLATVLAYDVSRWLRGVFKFRNFSHHTVGGFVAPVVAGKLLGLDAQQIAHAVGIAGSHNLASEGAETDGHISMMKCATYAFASQSGITGALLAQKGFTGALTVFENFVTAFEGGGTVTPIGHQPLGEGVMCSLIKQYPVYQIAQTPVQATVELTRRHGIGPSAVERIQVRLFARGTRTIVYDPKTKEEADHSLPYLLAAAIADGDLGLAQFEGERWHDPAIRDLMARVTIEPDDELGKLFPECWPCVVTILTTEGHRYSQRVDYPRGSAQDPMPDDELEAKFRKLAGNVLSSRQSEAVIDAVYDLENMQEAASLMSLLVSGP